MDKEQEKIEKVLDKYAMAFEVDGRYSPKPWAKEIVELLPELGYHKIKGKPPLLSDEQIHKVVMDAKDPLNCEICTICKHAIAQAQREADIKFYKGANQ